jgi:hypothetical protein
VARMVQVMESMMKATSLPHGWRCTSLEMGMGIDEPAQGKVRVSLLLDCQSLVPHSFPLVYECMMGQVGTIVKCALLASACPPSMQLGLSGS